MGVWRLQLFYVKTLRNPKLSRIIQPSNSDSTMEKWRLLIHEDGDDSASYTEFNTEQDAVQFLAAYCDTYRDDEGFNVTFNTNGQALIETQNEVVAFACVFPPLTEQFA